MENITAGDVVWLKSGGSAMTVDWIEDGKVSCAWFDGKKTSRDLFRATSLTKINPAGSGNVSPISFG